MRPGPDLGCHLAKLHDTCAELIAELKSPLAPEDVGASFFDGRTGHAKATLSFLGQSARKRLMEAQLTNRLVPAPVSPAFAAQQHFDATPAPLRGRVLTGKQKAAIVVRLLFSEGAEVPLKALPEEMQESLTEQVAEMRLIDRETLRLVAEEFLAELEGVGLAYPGGLEGALSILGAQLSPPTATRLRRMARKSTNSDPWDRIVAYDTDRIRAILEEESPEVGAVLLSKLAVARAAEILATLPGDKARRIAYAVSLTGKIEPALVAEIGAMIAGPMVAEEEPAFDHTPVDRIGAILNSTTSLTREEVLKGLEDEDAEFARKVRKAIFTYGDIPARIAPRDVPRAIRGLDQPTLIRALADPREEERRASEFILANISQRLATSLREEMEALGAVRQKDCEIAQAALVALIREMQAAGDLQFIPREDE